MKNNRDRGMKRHSDKRCCNENGKDLSKRKSSQYHCKNFIEFFIIIAVNLQVNSFPKLSFGKNIYSSPRDL